MIYVGQNKPSIEDTLKHFGVKGMKWGVSKNRKVGGRLDRVLYGKKGINDIKKRVSAGKTPRQARRREIATPVARAALAAYGALVVANLLTTAGHHASHNIAKKAASNRGKYETMAIMQRQLPKMAKKRGGVYNVTTV